MQCRQCREELTVADISVELTPINEGEDMLDIIITCPECEHRINAFVHDSDLIDLDE